MENPGNEEHAAWRAGGEVGPDVKAKVENEEMDLEEIRKELIYELPKQLEAELQKEFGDMEAVSKIIEGGPLDQALKSIDPEDPMYKRLQKIQETKIPLVNMLGVDSRIKRFILANPTMQRMAELSKRMEELQAKNK